VLLFLDKIISSSSNNINMGKLTSPGAKSLDTLAPAPDYLAAGGPSSSASAPLLLDFDDDAAPLGGKTPDAGTDEELQPYTEDPTYLGDEPPAFAPYTPRKHLLRNGKVVSYDAHLNSDVEAMYQWLQAEAAAPPPPLLHVEGTHSERSTVRENGKDRSSTSTVTDFSLHFDLSALIGEGCEVVVPAAGDKRRRGGLMARTATEGEMEVAMDVRDWCDAYIRSPARWKEFVLRKRLRGFDMDVLRFHVESMVRATNYRGQVRVRFPLENRSVVLAPDNWVCRVRYGWYRWIFYLTFLWLLTWPVLWLFTKRWDTIDAVYDENSRRWHR
jgi:hypothetical protein